MAINIQSGSLGHTTGQKIADVANPSTSNFSLEILTMLNSGWKLQGSPYMSGSDHVAIFYKYEKPYSDFWGS